MNAPEEYLEAALKSVSKGVFHFDKIPDSNFLTALCEFTTDCELYFPLNKAAGEVHEISCEPWADCVKQIRMRSSDLDEDYNDIAKFAEVEHLVLEVQNSQAAPHFDEGDISNWQLSLNNFRNLQSFKIILCTKRSIGKNRGGSANKAQLEEILDDLKYKINPFTGGKKPETAIERKK